MLRVTCVCAVTPRLFHKAAEKFGFCNTAWNVLLYNKYIKLGSVVNLQVQRCYFYIEMLFRRRHTCHCERASEAKVRGREREKWIERLPTGKTRRVSVRSVLKEDGLKLSACSFLNVKSFSDRGTGDSHFLSAAQTALYFNSLNSRLLICFIVLLDGWIPLLHVGTLYSIFKAAPINIFILKIGQLIMCNQAVLI